MIGLDVGLGQCGRLGIDFGRDHFGTKTPGGQHRVDAGRPRANVEAKRGQVVVVSNTTKEFRMNPVQIIKPVGNGRTEMILFQIR